MAWVARMRCHSGLSKRSEQLGFSSKKCRFPCNCNSTMDAVNLLHVTPFRWLFSQVEREDGFCLFKRAQPEKAVHGGAAITKRGFCVFITWCTSYRVHASRTSIPQH
eukprot:3498955-Amphidinium_carterae.1